MRAFAALLVITDAVLMQPVMMLVSNSSESASWVMAVAVSCAMAILMHRAGRLHAGAAGTGKHTCPATVIMALAWFLVGCGLTVMRAIGEATSTDITNIDTSSGVGQVSLSSALMAGTLFALYLAAGMVTFMEARESRNDAYAALQNTRTQLGSALSILQAHEATQQRLLDEARRIQREREDLRYELQHAFHQSAMLAEQAAIMARRSIATHLGDPAATAMTSTKHSNHPYN